MDYRVTMGVRAARAVLKVFHETMSWHLNDIERRSLSNESTRADFLEVMWFEEICRRGLTDMTDEQNSVTAYKKAKAILEEEV